MMPIASDDVDAPVPSTTIRIATKPERNCSSRTSSLCSLAAVRSAHDEEEL
jgi:hypothetical protein